MPANPPKNTAKRSLFLRKVCGFIRLCVCVQAMCECLQSVCEWKKLCWCSHVIFTCVLIWELENKQINTTLMHCRTLHKSIIYFNENIFPVQFHTWAKYISQEAYEQDISTTMQWPSLVDLVYLAQILIRLPTQNYTGCNIRIPWRFILYLQ